MLQRMILATALAVVPATAAGQTTAWELNVVPRVGFFHADKAMGLLAPGETGSPLVRMQNGATLGLLVELETPLRWISIRATADRTFGADLVERGRLDFENSTGGQPSELPLKSGTSVLNLAVGLAVRPSPRQLPIYLVGGIGVKSYDFGGGGWYQDPRYRFGGREATLAVHGGVGTELKLGAAAFNVEAAVFTSGFSGSESSNTSLPTYYRSLVQRATDDRLGHDLSLTVGMRIPVFGTGK